MGLMVDKTKSADAAAKAIQIMRASRRGVICGALGAGAAGLLAACGASGRRSPAAPESGDADDVDETEPIAVVSDIPVGGGLAVAGLVLIQLEEGEITAFDAACPHQGTQLPAPVDGVITCPAHASQFDIEDGSRIQGPAPTGLTEVPVRVEDDLVFRA